MAIQSLGANAPPQMDRSLQAPTRPAGTSAVPDPSATAQPPSVQQVEEAVARVQQFVEPVAQNLQFSVDKDSGKTVVKLIDVRSREVIRQIPTEEMLAIARALGRLQGMLVNHEA